MFVGKTVPVTGSTPGIGPGIAKLSPRTARASPSSGFGDVREIDRLRAGMAERFGTGPLGRADMSRPGTFEAMMARALAEFGAIHRLIDHAGIQHVAPVDQFPVEHWQAILHVRRSDG